ncbi:MAG: cellulase family glycosylhydrolase [Candidatus Dormibacteraeota bacterium]|nr:cellulase family glycosylhydrolase [Candidatus Dormibacteraeota bacterium]
MLGGIPTTAIAEGNHRSPAPKPAVIFAREEPVVYSAQLPNFVTRSGGTLLLDGQPYRFTGLNIYNANNRVACWYGLGTTESLDQTLTAIGPAQNVFRAWFFQPLATRNGQRDWSAFDSLMAVARAHNERVIATLGNGLGDCEGGAQRRDESWYASGYATARDNGMAATYREWVAEVVARYRDNPTILAWQLMNEAEDRTASGRCNAGAPRTLKQFTADMAGLVKGIDGNHLLSLGTWGLRDCGTDGSAYQDVHSVPGIDLCEIHDYSAAGPAAAQLALRLRQCRALGKPLFVGEIGVRVQDAGSLANRAAMLRGKLAADFGAGVVGALVWDWADRGQAAYSGYEVQPGDPALAVLAASPMTRA